jgi:dihydrolipoamide dehydrogenase
MCARTPPFARRSTLWESGARRAGAARFSSNHEVETESGLRLRADRIILCTGGSSRRLAVSGFEWTSTHRDAWALTSVPPSMLVVGAGATGVQVASIFNAFGSKVELFQRGPRILPTEDADVSAAVAEAFRASGVAVHENLDRIDSFEKTASGVRMNFTRNAAPEKAEAALVVVAVGWEANTGELNLAAAGVETDGRGFVKVDLHLRTTAPHVFAAGDVTGHLLFVPRPSRSLRGGHERLRGPTMAEGVSPRRAALRTRSRTGGLTEARPGRRTTSTAVVRFDATTRTIIDGRIAGFCKLSSIVRHRVLGCHVVGERAVEIAGGVDRHRCGHAGLGVRARAALFFRLCGDPRSGGRGRRPRGRAFVGPIVGFGGRDSGMSQKPESRDEGGPDELVEAAGQNVQPEPRGTASHAGQAAPGIYWTWSYA